MSEITKVRKCGLQWGTPSNEPVLITPYRRPGLIGSPQWNVPYHSWIRISWWVCTTVVICYYHHWACWWLIKHESVSWEEWFSDFLSTHHNRGKYLLNLTAGPHSSGFWGGRSTSGKFPGAAGAAGTGTALWEQLCWREVFHVEGLGRIQAGSQFHIILLQSD